MGDLSEITEDDHKLVNSLYKKSMTGEWKAVVEIYRKHTKKAHTTMINNSGDTALHVAVSIAPEDIVEELPFFTLTKISSFASILSVLCPPTKPIPPSEEMMVRLSFTVPSGGSISNPQITNPQTLVVTEEWLGYIGSDPKLNNIRFASIPNVVPPERLKAIDFPGFYEAAMTKMEAPFEQLLDRLEPPVDAILGDVELMWVIGIGNRRNIPPSYSPFLMITGGKVVHKKSRRADEESPSRPDVTRESTQEGTQAGSEAPKRQFFRRCSAISFAIFNLLYTILILVVLGCGMPFY
ncbi:isoform 2 of udp-glycosyltransferase 87a2 [Fagus crenata]